jgi:hypothetical protein
MPNWLGPGVERKRVSPIPERPSDQARLLSGTDRQECLTPQESTTIEGYARERSLPGGRSKALQMRCFSA